MKLEQRFEESLLDRQFMNGRGNPLVVAPPGLAAGTPEPLRKIVVSVITVPRF